MALNCLKFSMLVHMGRNFFFFFFSLFFFLQLSSHLVPITTESNKVMYITSSTPASVHQGSKCNILRWFQKKILVLYPLSHCFLIKIRAKQTSQLTGLDQPNHPCRRSLGQRSVLDATRIPSSPNMGHSTWRTCWVWRQPQRVREVLYKEELWSRQIQEDDQLDRNQLQEGSSKTEVSWREFLQWNIGQRASRQKQDARKERKGWTA